MLRKTVVADMTCTKCNRGIMRGAVSLCAVLAAFCVCVALVPQRAHADDNGGVSVLFVGNSLVHYNNVGVPKMLEPIARANGEKVVVDYVAIRGAYLADYAYGGADVPEQKRSFLTKLRKREWDYVVLEDYSTLTAAAPLTRMYAALRDAAKIVRREQPGAEILLYETHGYRNGKKTFVNGAWRVLSASELQLRTQAAYEVVGERLGLRTVPVGMYFNRHSVRFPKDSLLIGDRRHPSRAGYYLAACGFYRALFGRAPARAAAGFRVPGAREQKRLASSVKADAAMSPSSLALAVGKSGRVRASLGKRSFKYASLNPRIAQVRADGTVHVVSDGITVVYAQAADGTRAACLVSVERASLMREKLRFPRGALSLTVGKRADSGLRISAAVRKPRLVWRSSNPSVASVNAAGHVSALSPGAATLTVRDSATGATARRHVRVHGGAGYASAI